MRSGGERRRRSVGCSLTGAAGWTDWLIDSPTPTRVYVCATLRASLLRQSVTTREEAAPSPSRQPPAQEGCSWSPLCDALDLHFSSMKNIQLWRFRCFERDRAIIFSSSHFADCRFGCFVKCVNRRGDVSRKKMNTRLSHWKVASCGRVNKSHSDVCKYGARSIIAMRLLRWKIRKIPLWIVPGVVHCSFSQILFFLLNWIKLTETIWGRLEMGIEVKSILRCLLYTLCDDVYMNLNQNFNKILSLYILPLMK